MSAPTLDPAPTLRTHLDAYATVSDAHRTTHKELKEYAATVEQMRALLASVQALPDAYGDRLMDEAETQRLRQEQDAMMRTLRATRRALGLGKEGGTEAAATPAKRRAVKGVATSEAARASDESEGEDEGESEAEDEGESEAEAEESEAEAEGSEAEEDGSESVSSEDDGQGDDEDDGEATSESVRDTEEDGDTDDTRTSSASSEAVDDDHKDREDPSSAEDARAATSSQDDASASVSAPTATPSATAAAAAAPTPAPKPAAASRRSKLAPPRKVASTPAATPTPAPAAEDVRILPLPTAHHRAQDARLKRLKMLQARTGRPVFVSDRAEGAGGRRRRRREVRRGWRGEGRV